MKYILFALLIFSTPLFGQESNLVRQYNSDSTLMATGIMTGSSREGLWKYFNPKTNTLLTEG
ncbi:MAG: hypothetical protein ABJC55_10745, partial [Algoriphagus sp.]